MATLEEILSGWTARSSDSEQEKQERTERMIREAVEAHGAFSGMSYRIYAKGSYANNTNVRSNSDVDVAVQCRDVFYYEKAPNSNEPATTPYEGQWTPSMLRSELNLALRAKFGESVDTSGSTAIQIHSSSTRVEADVVPCFDYRFYFSDGSYREGARVYKTDGSHVENFSDLQLQEGVSKNTRTSRRYKRVVRILKRLSLVMAENGVHREVPSFFIECLAYNCPDNLFSGNSWTETVKKILAHIHDSLIGAEPQDEDDRWLEVSEAKYLFFSGQKWNRADGREFALAGWNYLDLENA